MLYPCKVRLLNDTAICLQKGNFISQLHDCMTIYGMIYEYIHILTPYIQVANKDHETSGCMYLPTQQVEFNYRHTNEPI